MDGMKLNGAFSMEIVSRVLSKVLSDKLGYDVIVNVGGINVAVGDSNTPTTQISVENAKIRMSNEDIRKLIKEFM